MLGPAYWYTSRWRVQNGGGSTVLDLIAVRAAIRRRQRQQSTHACMHACMRACSHTVREGCSLPATCSLTARPYHLCGCPQATRPLAGSSCEQFLRAVLVHYADACIHRSLAWSHQSLHWQNANGSINKQGQSVRPPAHPASLLPPTVAHAGAAAAGCFRPYDLVFAADVLP